MLQTTNYQLNQWEPEDRILRTDFNSDNQKTDAALKAQAEALAAANAVIAGKGNCRIATGTYTGTGKYGADSPNTLTFDFTPQLVIIQNAAGAMLDIGSSATFEQASMVLLRPLSEFYLDEGGYWNRLTWSGNSVSWYNNNNEKMQLNISDAKYLYLAIG